MFRPLLSGALLLSLSSGCATSDTAAIATVTPHVTSAPHGGRVVPYEGKNIEVVVQENGNIQVYAYDEAWQPADVFALDLRVLEMRFPPDGAFMVELDTDRARGCMMGRVNRDLGRRASRAPNAIIQLYNLGSLPGSR